MKTQREMFFPRVLKQPIRAPQKVIDSFASYRDAVVWCWQNRVDTGCGEKVDQSICANELGIHTPHMSRYVKPDSKAPMKLDPDYIRAFEAYTGWKAITQWNCKTSDIHPMEWVLEDQRAA